VGCHGLRIMSVAIGGNHVIWWSVGQCEIQVGLLHGIDFCLSIPRSAPWCNWRCGGGERGAELSLVLWFCCIVFASDSDYAVLGGAARCHKGIWCSNVATTFF